LIDSSHRALHLPRCFFSFAFDVPPVWLRRASQDEVDQPRADAGEAGCRSRFRQARDGLSKTPTSAEKRRGPINHRQVIDRRRHRVAFLLVTFLWAKPKEKSPAIRAEPALSAREGTGRVQAHAAPFQRVRGQILRCAQNDSEKQNWIPAFAGMTMG